MSKGKSFIIFLSFINSFLLLNSFTTIKLTDFTKTSFSLKEFVILEYTNNIKKDFNYEINFIFDKGNKASTKVFYYDSLDKIQRSDIGFINYVYTTSLKETRILKLSYNEPFYSDKKTYYIVLYDISNIYSDSVYLLNSLSYLPLKDSIFYHNSLDQELHFNFLVQENSVKYLSYQAREGGILSPSATSYFRITNDIGKSFIDGNCFGCSGYIKIIPGIKYYIETALYAKGDFDTKEMLFKLEKYGRNILLEEDKEVERKILCQQNIGFFTSISNLNIDDNLYFKFKIAPGGSHADSLYIKLYESDNFTKLENSFPIQKEEFDYEIKSNSFKEGFIYELKKKISAQKGVLFGIFIERELSPFFYYAMDPTTVNVIFSKKDLSDKSDGSDVGYIIGTIFGIIGTIIIIAAICYCCVKGKCDGNCLKQSYNYEDEYEYEYVPAIAKIKKRKN